MESGLDYLIKGDIVKIDVFKVLIDYEKEEDIPNDLLDDHLKYATHLCILGRPSKVNEKANAFKTSCGNRAYDVAVPIVIFCKCVDYKFNVY